MNTQGTLIAKLLRLGNGFRAIVSAIGLCIALYIALRHNALFPAYLTYVGIGFALLIFDYWCYRKLDATSFDDDACDFFWEHAEFLGQFLLSLIFGPFASLILKADWDMYWEKLKYSLREYTSPIILIAINVLLLVLWITVVIPKLFSPTPSLLGLHLTLGLSTASANLVWYVTTQLVRKSAENEDCHVVRPRPFEIATIIVVLVLYSACVVFAPLFNVMLISFAARHLMSAQHCVSVKAT